MSAPCPTCLPSENKCGNNASCDRRGSLWQSNHCVCFYANRPANIDDGYRVYVQDDMEYVVIVDEGVSCDATCANTEKENHCDEVPDGPGGECAGGPPTTTTPLKTSTTTSVVISSTETLSRITTTPASTRTDGVLSPSTTRTSSATRTSPFTTTQTVTSTGQDFSPSTTITSTATRTSPFSTTQTFTSTDKGRSTSATTASSMARISPFTTTQTLISTDEALNPSTTTASTATRIIFFSTTQTFTSTDEAPSLSTSITSSTTKPLPSTTTENPPGNITATNIRTSSTRGASHSATENPSTSRGASSVTSPQSTTILSCGTSKCPPPASSICILPTFEVFPSLNTVESFPAGWESSFVTSSQLTGVAFSRASESLPLAASIPQSQTSGVPPLTTLEYKPNLGGESNDHVPSDSLVTAATLLTAGAPPLPTSAIRLLTAVAALLIVLSI